MHPAQYHWSSYQYHGLGKPVRWLTPHPLYRGLGDNEESRIS
jgi:putative transposase